MRILIIGGGGREHALAWKLAQSPEVERVHASPGNPGIARCAECHPAGDGKPSAFLALAESIGADLTVVGPEAPLVAGIVDVFRQAGRAIVGPNTEAARLEGSKIFAKEFFQRLRIPTAAFEAVDNIADARRVLERFSFPMVLKADGLAAGKGVIIAHNKAEADRALESLGNRIVIEEFLQGEEVSFIALCDGHDVIPLAPTQDHKAVSDGDTGPNTGGMGAYCDSRILDEASTTEILDTVIRPTMEATGFTGFLYAGLMMTAEGPKVLEFNVRMGDPETQPLMHRMESDLAPILAALARGELGGHSITWRPGPSVCVVLASQGYPGSYATGFPIRGIEAAEATGATVFQAGTHIGAQGLETAGGRVLGVTASGNDLSSAIRGAYAATAKIQFQGMHFRRDIGRTGLGRYNVNVSGT